MIDGMTPLDAVVRILNNQLSSLMWIDEKVSVACIHSLSICKTPSIHDDHSKIASQVLKYFIILYVIRPSSDCITHTELFKFISEMQ